MARPPRPINRKKTSSDPWPRIQKRIQGYKDQMVTLQRELTAIGGGTVASFFRQAGLPAAVWLTSSETAHQPNEFCRLSDLIKDTQVFAHIFCQS